MNATATSLRRQRPRRLVRVLAPVLVGAALVSLGAVAVANQVATSRLDREQSLDQLDELQRSRTRAITDGIERLRTSVSLLAGDRAIADALADLRSGVAELDAAVAAGVTLLDPAEEAALDAVVSEIADDPSLQRALMAAGHPAPTAGTVGPLDPTARYLQYQYLRTPRPVTTAAADLDGPGAAYARAVDRHGPVLERLRGPFADVWLVDLDRNRVLHSLGGGPELGVDATVGLIGESVAGRLLTIDLRRTTPGEVALTDVGPYLGGPSMFLAEVVRDGGEIVGAVVARVPVEMLDALMTAEGRFAEVGLGETGETYVVGRDQRLRSSARGHVEDPDGYVAALRAAGEDELADLVEATGSTVLVTQIATRPVRTALDGRSFSGRAGGLGSGATLTVAAPLGVAGLDWVVVAEVDRGEALAESSQQLTRQLLLAALLLPLVGAAGVVLSWHLVRPVRPLISAVERVAEGADDPGLVDRGRDEFGHLARQLELIAARLGAEQTRLDDEGAAITHLLEATFPADMVEAVRAGDGAQISASGTVVVIGIDAGNEASDSSTDVLDLDQLLTRHDEVIAAIDATAAEHRAIRFRASGDRLLYLVGVDEPDAGVEAAEAFSAEVISANPDVHIGRATGLVAWSVVGARRPTTVIWGRPVRDALELAARGRRGSNLAAVDGSRPGSPEPGEAQPGEPGAAT